MSTRNRTARSTVRSAEGFSGDSGPTEAPTLEGFQYTDEGGAAASSLSFIAPSGITAGELLMVIAFGDESSGGNPTVEMTGAMASAGWNYEGTGGSDLHNAQCFVWTKVAEGGEGSFDVTMPNTCRCFGWYCRVSGVDDSAPVHKVQFSTSTAQTYNISGVTTEVPFCLIFAATGYDDDAAFTLNTAGWAEQDDQIDGGFFGGMFAIKDQDEAGDTGNCNVTANKGANQSASVQVAIRA